MKVSRRSWHYRLYRYMSNVPKGPRYLLPWSKAERADVDPPSSLCPYAWSIFLGLVGTAALVAVAAPVAAALAVVFGPLWLLYRALVWADGKAGLARLRAERRAAKTPREPEPPPEKQPSLLAEYVRAKKAKACPPIELVD